MNDLRRTRCAILGHADPPLPAALVDRGRLPACFIVRDHDKQALAYVYYGNKAARRSSAKLLARDEAFLIAVNIAKLPSVPRQIPELRSPCSNRQWRS
jgi:hypothetical protein